MLDHDKLKRVAASSGLTKAELASLYDVTRQTLYNWMAGSAPRTKYLLQLADTVTEGLDAAIRRGILPLPSLNDAERRRKLESMYKHLRTLTASKQLAARCG